VSPNDDSGLPRHVGQDDTANTSDVDATMIAFEVRTGNESVLHLSGELDIESAARLTDALQPLTSLGRTIELDLSELSFIDCSGINVLCHAALRLGAHGRLVISHPTTAVRRTLELTGLDGFIDCGDSRSLRNDATAEAAPADARSIPSPSPVPF